MSGQNIEKLANAFVPKAIPSHLIGSAALKAVGRFGRKYGGLWVGGKVTAKPDGLRFVPNRMNLAFHEGLESIYIPLASIRAVTASSVGSLALWSYGMHRGSFASAASAQSESPLSLALMSQRPNPSKG